MSSTKCEYCGQIFFRSTDLVGHRCPEKEKARKNHSE
jgi:hypothetical protein